MWQERQRCVWKWKGRDESFTPAEGAYGLPLSLKFFVLSVVLCCAVSCFVQVFARGGNVLLPIDSSGRMLEVLLVLDQLWYQNK